jgi:hypothetical protein
MPVTINGSTGLTTNNGSVFTDASGNAGVGTSNPAVYGARLAVSGGNIIADFDRTIGFQWSGGLNQYFKGISGVPQLAGGARGLHVFNYDNDASQGIRFWGGTFASKVEFGGFDSAGRFTVPSQPMFTAFSNNTSPITTSTTQRIMPYTNVVTNTGSFYSSNRFTAPVAGRYLFSFTALALTGGGANLILFKNGATIGGGGSNARCITTTNEANMGQSVIVTLAANDYVEVYYYNDGGGNSFFGAHGSFCGTLLG